MIRKSFWNFIVCLVSAVALGGVSFAADTNGFAVKFTAADGKTSDLMVLPNLRFYVEGGQPATPFLPPGKFTAVFEGSISGDLRTDYFFKAEELGGALKLEVNNTVVLETSTPGALSSSGKILPLAMDISSNTVLPSPDSTACLMPTQRSGSMVVMRGADASERARMLPRANRHSWP